MTAEPGANTNISRMRDHTFLYTQIESALASQLHIPHHARPAFAAKLRHLRNLGIPRSRPGSGKRISYTRLDARELLLALLVESVGSAPRTAAGVASRWRNAERVHDFVAVLPGERTIFATHERIFDLLRTQAVLTIVNIGRASSDLEKTLERP